MELPSSFSRRKEEERKKTCCLTVGIVCVWQYVMVCLVVGLVSQLLLCVLHGRGLGGQGEIRTMRQIPILMKCLFAIVRCRKYLCGRPKSGPKTVHPRSIHIYTCVSIYPNRLRCLVHTKLIVVLLCSLRRAEILHMF